ncbi:uncharacterized protein J3R85_012487 [Psidium guajava]|nr:uncharacterized protein J3R85_012487 [Psidium guajava]
MACTAHMASPNMGSACFYGDISPLSRSMKQVRLPSKSDISSSSSSSSPPRQQVVASLVATPVSSSSPSSTSCPSEAAAAAAASLGLCPSWREIQGCAHWEHLLEPLHPLLRREIVRYGEFVTACYLAFDLDPASKRYLNCKYGKGKLLEEVGMGGSGYEVTKYIYATPDVSILMPNGAAPCCGRWIGYVAVASDSMARRLGRRDVVISFRGTVTSPEWIANFMSSLTPARLDPHDSREDVKVESGFLSLYTADEAGSSRFGIKSCREQLLSEVSRLIKKHKGEEMSITLAGHSMGSSLALLLAYDISELGLNKVTSKNDSIQDIPITVFSFGGPRVGNSAFKERCDELGIKVLRIVNVNDPITKLPGVVFNEHFRVLGGKFEFPWSCSCYAHVGVELALDFFNVQNPSCVHDLETYLSLLKFPNNIQIESEANLRMDDFIHKARDWLQSVQNLNMQLPVWRNVATNMVSLIPSQRT